MCLLQLFSGHFDTTTGKKEEKDSYKKIATELSLDPAEILFLTDKPTGLYIIMLPLENKIIVNDRF